MLLMGEFLENQRELFKRLEATDLLSRNHSKNQYL
jgi:hypothetical protein